MIRERFAGIARLGMALGIVLAPGIALAQSTIARVEGVVNDDSGAPVPGVSVTGTNTGTNFSKTATTDGEGNYTLTPLPLGPYVIKAELSGFQTALRPRVRVELNAKLRVDFALALGAVVAVDAVWPVAGGQVAASLLVFMIVYAIVFTAGSLYILRLIAKGPGSGDLPPSAATARRAACSPA